MNVGARLKELREQRNISQNKLALLSDLSQGFVRQIELGEKNPTVDSVSKLCSGLGITLQEFFQNNIPEEINPPPPVFALSRADDTDADLPDEAVKQIEDFRAYIRQKYKKPD
ncbi:MAG: helix-turn-helix domain-containing protein [Negativicutes bacterium]